VREGHASKCRRAGGRIALALGATALTASLGAGIANGERAQLGDLIVSLSGTVSPHRLPRHSLVPASVKVSGELRTSDGAPLPSLSRVELAMAAGSLDTRGLPVCRPAQIAATRPPSALAACRDALIGRGSLAVTFFFPEQRPYTLHASLRAFNGRLGDGHRIVWLHAFSPRPTSAFLLPFLVIHRPGAFGTVLVSNVPAVIGPLPRLALFQLTFGRRFAYRGQRHSLLSADCPVPPRFTAGLFPLARATYTLSDGRTVSATVVRGCRVQG
jgi:hypothetical protein